MTTETKVWLVVGFTAQAIFTARFLTQWIASERKKDSVVPQAFWWLSLVGGMMLFAYASHNRDPVIMFGQGLGVFIYVRNLMLVAKGKKNAEKKARREEMAMKGMHRIDNAALPKAS